MGLHKLSEAQHLIQQASEAATELSFSTRYARNVTLLWPDHSLLSLIALFCDLCMELASTFIEMHRENL